METLKKILTYLFRFIVLFITIILFSCFPSNLVIKLVNENYNVETGLPFLLLILGIISFTIATIIMPNEKFWEIIKKAGKTD